MSPLATSFTERHGLLTIFEDRNISPNMETLLFIIGGLILVWRIEDAIREIIKEELKSVRD